MGTANRIPLRIEDYGLIGDMHTCALVGKDASIDFMCWPQFDSPSVFARLLDTAKGSTGHWSIQPDLPPGSFICKQNYLASTNILHTKFIHEIGVVNVTDFFAVTTKPDIHSRMGKSILLRKVECVRGSMPLKIEINIMPTYAKTDEIRYLATDVRDAHDIPYFEGYNVLRKKSVFFQTLYHEADYDGYRSSGHPGIDIGYCRIPEGAPIAKMFSFDKSQATTASAVFDLGEEDRIDMIMATNSVGSFAYEFVDTLERETHAFWTDWIQKCSYRGRAQQEVERSLLILKLLTFEPTGAIIASPTFSPPEAIGFGRNWDYRYTWVRDSSFTVYVFLKMGFIAEAEAYINFVFDRVHDWQKKLRGVISPAMNGVALDRAYAATPTIHLPLMFSINGKPDLPETELNHFGGYMDSKPVRIGNAATGHVQLDIYGELMDAIYLYNKHGKPLSYQQWLAVRRMIDFVCTQTDSPHNSIWEVRGERRNFTYSKIMLWVALDRALRLSDKRPNFPCRDRARWLATRDTLYEDIMAPGFNYELNTFIQSYESHSTLDSSVLIAPLVFFIAPNDPQFLGTLEAIMRSPEKGGLTSAGFVHRYDTSKVDDGVGGKEGSFIMCTLWCCEAMARAGQYNKKLLKEARRLFEQVTNFRNHVGMLSEEIATSGEQLGNTPQAFSHLAYVSAAINLEKVTAGLRY